jgi:hypothetical protein
MVDHAMQDKVSVLWHAYWELLEAYKKQPIEKRTSSLQSACIDVLNNHGLHRPTQNVIDFTMFLRSTQLAMEECMFIKES